MVSLSDTPQVLADIDAEWLSRSLGGRVDDFSSTTIGSGEGFMGQLARVTLRGSNVPDSVIVKLPTSDPGGQMIGQMMREIGRAHV